MSNPPPQREHLIFRHPPDNRMEFVQNHAVVHVPGSSGVALHETLAQLWQAADGKRFSDLYAMSGDAGALAAQLMALRAAGLLLPPLAESPRQHSRPLSEPLPLVSVIIVTRDGRHHLQECLPSLAAQSYSHFEVIIVDDASSDGTLDYVRENFPAARVIELIGGPNFAAGCNRGIEQATGELIFLLNNDTVLDPHCLEEMVAAQAGRAGVGGVAAMLRFYDNRPFVNGLGTFVPRQGLGHDAAIGNLDVGQFDRIGQVPLLCFGAALIPRAAIERTGLLDEAYRFYYEDADWSYRARALGLELIAAPRAHVYHKFGASTSALPSAFKVRLASRNRLRFTLKNLSIWNVVRQLITYGLGDVMQSLIYLKHGQLDQARAVAQAWREFLKDLPDILRDRRRTWSGPARQPVDLGTLAQAFPTTEMQGPYPLLTPWAIERKYRPYLARRTTEPLTKRMLIISSDVINASMGGLGIRYWELARVLANHAQVTLAVPAKTDLRPDTFSIQSYTQGREETLKPLVQVSDIILLSGFIVYHAPFLRDVSQHVVVDLVDPTMLENFERFSARPMDEQMGLHQASVVAYNDLFKLGDFFVCGSEKQRDFWLGALTAANRVNPLSYSNDPTLRRLIDVVPFGLPLDPPQRTRCVLKGVYPSIGDQDRVILWCGGLWDWFDPLAAIEAMPAVLERVPGARLFFMGAKHPNPEVPPSRMAQRAIARAEELGLKDRAIFFKDWIPYAERVNYLLEADVAVSLHRDHVETRFSVRTRMTDYLWARLPMVLTGGDTLSDMVAAKGLGRVVPAEDVKAVAEALIEMLQSPIDRAQFDAVVDMFRWPRVAEPLVRYVTAPWRNGERNPVVAIPPVKVTPLAQLPFKAVASLRERGLRGLVSDVRSYLLWRWRRW